MYGIYEHCITYKRVKQLQNRQLIRADANYWGSGSWLVTYMCDEMETNSTLRHCVKDAKRVETNKCHKNIVKSPTHG